MGGTAAGGRGHQGQHPAPPRRAPPDPRSGVAGAGRDRALGTRRAGGLRGRRRHRAGPRRRRGRQGQVDGDPGNRPQRGARRARCHRLGNRPRRAHRAARRRPAQPPPGAGDPPQPRGDPGDLPPRDGRGGPSGARGPDRRPGRAGRRGPAAPAREVPAREGGRLRRELRRRRERHPGRRRIRGQRPDVPDPARRAGFLDGAWKRWFRRGPTSTCSCNCCRGRARGSG